MKVSAKDSREAQAVVLAFRLADRDLRKRINDATRSTFNAPWRAGIAGRVRTRQERAVLVKGARVKAGNPPEFIAASSTRALSGGLVPDTQWHPVELGSKEHKQFPARRKKGPVFRTLDEMVPRVASLWAQLVVKVYSDAAEGK